MLHAFYVCGKCQEALHWHEWSKLELFWAGDTTQYQPKKHAVLFPTIRENHRDGLELVPHHDHFRADARIGLLFHGCPFSRWWWSGISIVGRSGRPASWGLRWLMDNYADVVHQMEQAGCVFKPKDLPLQVPTAKRRTCGLKGKWWYWLQLWRPRHPNGLETGAVYVVGRFGCYSARVGIPERKIDLDFKPLSAEERARYAAERRAAEDKARRDKAEAAARAAITAGELWKRAARAGRSAYLVRKGVEAESCRFVQETVLVRRGDPTKPPLELPPGTLVIPLIRYDKAREEALRGLQFIKPDGFKLYTEDLAKTGCAVRLGALDESTRVAMVCEGYATGLTIRQATGRRWPVFVALDAYNLMWVVEILRREFRDLHLLVCADDDWKTRDHDGPNPGRHKAKVAARTTPRCDIVWPVFDPATRQEKDTDFNDLQLRQGIEAVERQLVGVLTMIERGVRLGR